ncbi:hypothetical protein C8R41DRAFT_726147, partial [Lentinula lateritia]
KVPILKEDLSNWVIYKQRVKTKVLSHRLGRHMTGTIRPPRRVTEISGDYYLTGSATPLTDDEYEKCMEARDEYEAKEAQLCKILYETIPISLFLRIREEVTAHDTWKQLCSVIEDRPPISADTLHHRMMSLRTPEEGDIRETLTQLQMWYDELAGMGHRVPDDSFMTYIRQSSAANVTHNGEVIDTGATRHFSPIQSNFKNLVRIAPSPVTAADGRSFVVTARGD